MTVSPGERRELRNELPAGLAANENLSARSRIADARADPLTAPALVLRQIREIGAMSLARVHDVVALRAGDREHVLNRPDRRPGERQVVAHRVDVSALAAEVGLHVDDQHDGVVRTQIAVVWPGIGIGLDMALHCRGWRWPRVQSPSR